MLANFPGKSFSCTLQQYLQSFPYQSRCGNSKCFSPAIEASLGPCPWLQCWQQVSPQQYYGLMTCLLRTAFWELPHHSFDYWTPETFHAVGDLHVYVAILENLGNLTSRNPALCNDQKQLIINISANFRKLWGSHHILDQVARYNHPQNTIQQSHNSASIHMAVEHISGSLRNFGQPT